MIKIGQSMHPEWVGGDLGRLDEELRQIKDVGADCCELVLQGLDVVFGGRVIQQRLDELLETLGKYEFEYTLHMPHGLDLLNSEMLDVNMGIFRAGIELALAASIKLINYHAGKTKSNDKSLILKEAERIKTLAQEAPDILFCMENALFFSDDEFSAALNASDMIDFYEQVNLPNFRLTFDIGHSFLRHRGDKNALLEDLVKVLPYTGHIHLHDNCGLAMETRGPGSGRLVSGIGDIHLPLGWGRVPVEEALARITDYNGILNLEIEHRFHKYYGDCFSYVRNVLNSSSEALPNTL